MFDIYCPPPYFVSISHPKSRKEGTSRKRSGKGAIRKRSPLQKTRWEKTKLTIRYLYQHEAPTAQKELNTKALNKKNHHRSITLE